VARKAEFFGFFWPSLPRKFGLGTNMAEKAELLWPRLPRKLGRGQACQVLPGRIFLVSLAKNPESPAWSGFARRAGFLTGLLMQGLQSKVAKRLGVLKRIKHLLPVSARKIYATTMIIPILAYASIVWGDKNNRGLMDSIQVLQNRAAKMVLDRAPHSSSTEALSDLN